MSQSNNSNEMFSSNSGIFSSPPTNLGFVGMMCSSGNGETGNSSNQSLNAVDSQQAYNAMRQTMSYHSGKFSSQVDKLHQLIKIQEQMTGKNPLTGEQTGSGTHAHLFKEVEAKPKLEDTVEWSGSASDGSTGSLNTKSGNQNKKAKLAQKRKVKKEEEFETQIEKLLDNEASLAGPEYVPQFVQLMKKADSIKSRRMILTLIMDITSTDILKKLSHSGCVAQLKLWIDNLNINVCDERFIIIKILKCLLNIPIKTDLLKQTRIPISVNKLSKKSKFQDVAKTSKELLEKWKNSVNNKRQREEKSNVGPPSKRLRTKPGKGMFASVTGSNSDSIKSENKSASIPTKRRVKTFDPSLQSGKSSSVSSTNKPMSADDIHKMKRQEKIEREKKTESNSRPKKKGVRWADPDRLVTYHVYSPQEDSFLDTSPSSSSSSQNKLNIPSVAWRTPPRVRLPPTVHPMVQVNTEAATKEQEREQRTRAMAFIDPRQANEEPDHTIAAAEPMYNDAFVPNVPTEKQRRSSPNEDKESTLADLVANPSELTQLLNRMKSDSHSPSQPQQPPQQSQHQYQHQRTSSYQQSHYNNNYNQMHAPQQTYYGQNSYQSFGAPPSNKISYSPYPRQYPHQYGTGQGRR
eukprot:gb/GECH01009362.1/.p1 GENE.gb/GECH01009362.1/~~gb/GECH01009362.1/.p1  ORF type:complete len:632 (+),score=105.87 gb/GECH01009362.1/:1-1896(+)